MTCVHADAGPGSVGGVPEQRPPVPEPRDRLAGVFAGYRFGEKPEAIRFDVVRDDLKWVCRKRGNRIVPTLAYPVTIAADLATSPISAVVFEIYVFAH